MNNIKNRSTLIDVFINIVHNKWRIQCIMINTSMNQTHKILVELIAIAKKQGITQRELAGIAGISPEALSRAKNRGDFVASRLDALADAVDMELVLQPKNSREQSIEKLKKGSFFGIGEFGKGEYGK